MNVICITGRLTRSPETRTTTSGKTIVEFSVAVQKAFKREGEPDADFFRCKAWDKTGEFVSKYLDKGRLVAVTGRMEQRKYTDKDGNNREVYEINAERVDALDKADNPATTATEVKKVEADEYDPWGSDE